MPHEPPWESLERVLLAVVVDRAAGARLAERVAVDDPHVHAVDLLDVRDLVLVPLRRPLGEEVVTLGHVRVGVDDADALGQFRHRSLLRDTVAHAQPILGLITIRGPCRFDPRMRASPRGAATRIRSCRCHRRPKAAAAEAESQRCTTVHRLRDRHPVGGDAPRAVRADGVTHADRDVGRRPATVS